MSSFRNIHTNEIVRVLKEDENFYILDSGQKIDKKLFVQSYVSNDAIIESQNQVESQQISSQTPTTSPTDEIDVNAFFAAKPIIEGTEKLKTVDTSKILDEPKRGQGWIPNNIKDLTQVNPTSPTMQTNSMSLEEQKRIMIENYNRQHQGQQGQQIIGNKMIDPNDDVAVNQMLNQLKTPEPAIQLNENGLTEAQEIVRQQQIEVDGVDPFKDKIIAYRAKMGLDPLPVSNPKIIQPVQPVQQVQPQQNKSQVPYNHEEDEVIKMFKKFKRNHSISIKFSLKDKIGKPEFIQMMAEGLDGDIIQFYTDELFKKFISDIDSIKNDIYSQIYKKVYGVDKPVEIEEIIENKPPKESEIKSGTEIELIPGGKTKGGKQKYKFIDNKGKIVELLIDSAQKKQYKPATKKDIKKYGK